MKHIKLLFLLLALPPVSTKLPAQPPAGTLQPLSFLSGRWIETTPDSWEEEYWSPIFANSMVGHFRVIKDGAPVFYEFWTIEVDDGKTVFKMKHFNHGLVGWEEKADIVRLLATTGPNQVQFSKPDGSLTLRYELKGDELISTLIRTKDGKKTEDVFHLHRAAN